MCEWGPGYTTQELWFDFRQDPEILFFCTSFTAVGRGGTLPWVKRVGREDDHAPVCIDEF
jgi:hypothetical protein